MHSRLQYSFSYVHFSWVAFQIFLLRFSTWLLQLQIFCFNFSGPVISEEYVLEYGRDCLEMHIGAVEHGDRALVVDDLIATGGTLGAAINLLGKIVVCSLCSKVACIYFLIIKMRTFCLKLILMHFISFTLNVSERAGAEVVECACVIEIPELKVCLTCIRMYQRLI